jgi:hypothetical protein
VRGRGLNDDAIGVRKWVGSQRRTVILGTSAKCDWLTYTRLKIPWDCGHGPTGVFCLDVWNVRCRGTNSA